VAKNAAGSVNKVVTGVDRKLDNFESQKTPVFSAGLVFLAQPNSQRYWCWEIAAWNCLDSSSRTMEAMGGNEVSEGEFVRIFKRNSLLFRGATVPHQFNT